MHIRPSLSIYPEFQSFAILRFQTFRDGASLSWLVLAWWDFEFHDKTSKLGVADFADRACLNNSRTPLDAACRETSSSKVVVNWTRLNFKASMKILKSCA
ncbi:hypothetical protein TWF788_003726 [Orbilia oligospora]|uniref:Uncharacterized protein n=1 Tax=Orbilia oligospora TaxID=2813651 RepID=A0A7C8P7Z9_ORBOL|nr:hypothetical protein TWF788_003726 [Orbilia oligospora]